uniref:Cycloartenol synthase n=1 Tax=Arundo donax TaxID=35708 RepID=A0A0A9GNL4_ARUDO
MRIALPSGMRVNSYCRSSSLLVDGEKAMCLI